MEISFGKSSEKRGCSFSFSVGSLPVLIGIGALAKYLGWIDWSWITIILVSVGVSAGLTLLLFVPIIIIMISNARFVSELEKESKAERKQRKQKEKAYQEQLKREAKEAEIARKAKEEYEKKRAMEQQQESTPQHANNENSAVSKLNIHNKYNIITNSDRYPVVYHNQNDEQFVVMADDQETLERFVQARIDQLPQMGEMGAATIELCDLIEVICNTDEYAGILYLLNNKASYICKAQLQELH